MVRYLVAAIFALCPLFGQFEPESAHVRLFFPQLVDGGDDVQRWQTTFVAVNPNILQAATITLSLYNEQGGPLRLNFGGTTASTHTFTIPPSGSRTLRSAAISRDTQVGWALMESDVPVSATVIFRAIEGGKPTVDLAAPATLPTIVYRSAANKQLGIAIANPSYTSAIDLTLRVFDKEGRGVGSTAVSLNALSHTSFVLGDRLPRLEDTFEGSIMILSETLNSPFLAWTLNADGGLLSTLPSGALRWPPSHLDRMALAYRKALNAAQTIASGFKVDLKTPNVPLEITLETAVNASTTGGHIRISLALSEFFSDSESELGFVIAHELGHIIQARAGRNLLVTNNAEQDADAIAMMVATSAGFEVYAAAGALGKLAMASKKDVNLAAQNFDGLSDPYASFLSRLDALYANFTNVCRTQSSANCSGYKQIVHPDLPPATPLLDPGSPVER